MGMKVKCRFCGRYYDEEDLKIELDMGPLCDNCIAALCSHGERPVIANGMSYGEWLEERKKAKKGARR